VELFRATVVPQQHADARNGHGIRKLHLPAHSNDDVEWIELAILQQLSAAKRGLLEGEPWLERSIPSQERGIFRRWMAQRYSRSEFPDAFVNWLKESGAGKRFERLGKKHSGSLVGIYFDLENDAERSDPTEPYPLGIYLVYPTSDTDHEAAAQKAVVELGEVFRSCCYRDSRWQWIELLYCDAISDKAFTLQAANTFRRWRFEHRSLSGEPIDQVD